MSKTLNLSNTYLSAPLSFLICHLFAFMLVGIGALHPEEIGFMFWVAAGSMFVFPLALRFTIGKDQSLVVTFSLEKKANEGDSIRNGQP